MIIMIDFRARKLSPTMLGFCQFFTTKSVTFAFAEKPSSLDYSLHAKLFRKASPFMDLLLN